jgi:hypothetical protein
MWCGLGSLHLESSRLYLPDSSPRSEYDQAQSQVHVLGDTVDCSAPGMSFIPYDSGELAQQEVDGPSDRIIATASLSVNTSTKRT